MRFGPVKYPCPGGPAIVAADVASLRPTSFVRFLRQEDLLFWLLNLYLFLEYVRPQTLYPVLDVLPYTGLVIVTATGLLFLNRSRKVASRQTTLFALFLAVAVLSSLMALSPAASFQRLWVLVSWMLVYSLIINIANTENRLLFVLSMFLLYNFKMAQFAVRGWAAIGFGFGKDGTGGGPGWFENAGEFGIEMCMFLAISTFYILGLRNRWPRWKQIALVALPCSAILGIIASASRGAVLGGVAVMGWSLLKSRRRIGAGIVIGATCIAAYAIIPDQQRTRFSTAGEDGTSMNRTLRWEKGIRMVEKYPILGVGYENWAVADERMFGGNGAFCHNIFIQCASELGLTGLMVFVAMILSHFATGRHTRRVLVAHGNSGGFLFFMSHGLDAALVGYLVSGFFVTVLYYPLFWVNTALAVALHNVAEQGESQR